MSWVNVTEIPTPCLRVPHSSQQVDPKLYALTSYRYKEGTIKPDLSTLLRTLLLRDVDEWRIQSYLNFTITVTIKTSFGATPVLDGEDHVGWSSYDLTLIDDDDSLTFPRTLAIVYSNGGVRIFFDRKLQGVGAYLDRLAADVRISDKRLQLKKTRQRVSARECQAEWWAVNGKSFKLMQLPAELRETIFKYALDGEVEMYPITAKYNRRRRRARKPEPTMGLLSTTRQVYEEAREVFYKGRLIKVAHPKVLRLVLKNTPFATSVQKLTLSLNHYDFLQFFGMDRDYPGDRLVYKHRTCAGMLRDMQLTSLELGFSPPGSATSWSWLDDACQKVVVGWILEAAWEHVKGHPVMLTGHIKTEQKTAFESANIAWKQACEAKRKAYGLTLSTPKVLDHDQWLADSASEEGDDDDESGVRLRREAQDETAVDGPIEYDGHVDSYDLPARCTCKVRCARETWDADA